MPVINGFRSAAEARREINRIVFARNRFLLASDAHKVGKLLADPLDNPKVAKNGKLDVLTFPLHLAPFDLSGFQVCPQASAGCAAACLHTAGNPAYMAQKERSRKAKTVAYFKARDAFMALLTFEMLAAQRKAVKAGKECAFRLNATSDLPWERRKVTIDGFEKSLMDLFEDCTFYDYTKVTKRALACARGDRWPSNYHLAFSKSETNDADCIEVLRAGGTVAVVFDHKAGLPDAVQASRGRLAICPWGAAMDWMVIDGDAHDYRPADPKGTIVGLKAKGDARSDTSGFVVR